MKKINSVFAIMTVIFVFLFASCGENNDNSNNGGNNITIPWIYSIDGDELFLDNPSADQRIWFNKQ